MKTLLALALALASLLFTGCSTATSQAVSDIAKANAASAAHVKMEVDIPPNRISYERWIGDTNAPAK